MILTIDIGNSSTKFGVFDNDKLVQKLTIPTIRDESSESIFIQIKEHIPPTFFSIIISSVVKELHETYQTLGNKYFNLNPIFANHAIDYGFSINYFPPESCGSDRLIAVFAAMEKYGTPVIVCDFGTATNIEVVNEQKEYLGGIITPGINTLATALFEKTSKLPKVELSKPEKVIGNSTVSSIQSGIYFGYIGLVDGILQRMIEELNEKPTIISTGGFAKLLAEESKFVKVIEENLILEGLRLVHQKIIRD